MCREGGGFTAASAGSWYNCNSKLVHQTIPLPSQSLFTWFECLATSTLQVLLYSLEDSDCNLHAMQSSKITNFQTINVRSWKIANITSTKSWTFVLVTITRLTVGFGA